MRPPSIHSNFFSSLKQVEKRLKLESTSQPFTPIPLPAPPITQQPPEGTDCTPSEYLSSPIFVNSDKPNSSFTNNLSVEESEPPSQFLSNSIGFSETHEDPPPIKALQEQDPPESSRIDFDGVDEIEMLIKLLGLSGSEEEEEREKQGKFGLGLKNDDCGFYGKIVGVKGPKCGKEVERLEGWIKHFMNGGKEGKREPLRLAHLLLGKAVFLSEDSQGLGGLGFPSTAEEFLQNDPPKD